MYLPEIALIISTCERPSHLWRALRSIQCQRDCEGKMEVVVTDDGSRDDTLDIVKAFAREVDFPVRATTHIHRGFQLARCRNEGVAASTAPYLLFTDGDCILPPDHVASHLRHRRRGVVSAGDCYRLEKSVTEQITEATIRSGEYLRWISRDERLRVASKTLRGWLYRIFRFRMRPRLTGSNIGIWREDYQRVNGFDENYVGWGLEDRDLQLRLSRLGLRFNSILSKTAAYHMWHPTDPTFARNNNGTANLRYYRRSAVLTRCRNGLKKRKLSELAIRVVGDAAAYPRMEKLLRRLRITSGHAEVEILFMSDSSRFSGMAEINVLIRPLEEAAPAMLLRHAHLVIATDYVPDIIDVLPFPSSDGAARQRRRAA
jgi:glycosyltransferase involved in cell wall biosynthesis